MIGAILAVSGPTAVGPLAAFVWPSDRLQRILPWEGSLIDPVDGILGAVVLHAVLAPGDPIATSTPTCTSAAVLGAGSRNRGKTKPKPRLSFDEAFVDDRQPAQGLLQSHRLIHTPHLAVDHQSTACRVGFHRLIEGKPAVSLPAVPVPWPG
jgi:hypothetical protein